MVRIEDVLEDLTFIKDNYPHLDLYLHIEFSSSGYQTIVVRDKDLKFISEVIN